MANEADTCRKYVLPKLYAAGWDDDAITEQRYFTDGRIVVIGTKTRRKVGLKASNAQGAAERGVRRQGEKKYPGNTQSAGILNEPESSIFH
jgi:hypothetical protein